MSRSLVTRVVAALGSVAITALLVTSLAKHGLPPASPLLLAQAASAPKR